MGDSNAKNNNDSNNLKTKWFVIALCLIALTILAFYFANFHGEFSPKNEVWGTFGDYVGGILNPLIAAFAFYLIAESYKLQKSELEATRKLLEVSTDAQKNQIKLAALTAMLNSNLTRIGFLRSEKSELSELLSKVTQQHKQKMKDSFKKSQIETDLAKKGIMEFQNEIDYDHYDSFIRMMDIDTEIKTLTDDNFQLSKDIAIFLKQGS